MSEFHRANEENLTRSEAAARSAAVEVSTYQVHVDLSAAAAQQASTYPVQTRIELSLTADSSGELFLDYIGDSVESLRINAESRPTDTHAGTARILLSGLKPGRNVVEIHSHSRYSRSGEGMHRFLDP